MSSVSPAASAPAVASWPADPFYINVLVATFAGMAVWYFAAMALARRTSFGQRQLAVRALLLRLTKQKPDLDTPFAFVVMETADLARAAGCSLTKAEEQCAKLGPRAAAFTQLHPTALAVASTSCLNMVICFWVVWNCSKHLLDPTDTFYWGGPDSQVFRSEVPWFNMSLVGVAYFGGYCLYDLVYVVAMPALYGEAVDRPMVVHHVAFFLLCSSSLTGHFQMLIVMIFGAAEITSPVVNVFHWLKSLQTERSTLGVAWQVNFQPFFISNALLMAFLFFLFRVLLPAVVMTLALSSALVHGYTVNIARAPARMVFLVCIVTGYSLQVYWFYRIILGFIKLGRSGNLKKNAAETTARSFRRDGSVIEKQ